ncbi:MAG TPA: sensor histidine kinase [Ornithinibacter sp.]|nr:sensor histidine kinase [Ornithinibacter sp.]
MTASEAASDRAVAADRDGSWSVAAQTTALVVGLVATVVLAGLGAAYVQARRSVTQQSSAQVLAVAQSVAAEPAVVAGVRTGDVDGSLQPLAEGVRRRTSTDFVVIMSPQGIRYTHPDPTRIGQAFLGHTEEALAGGVVLEDYAGTLGPSRRAVVPVLDGSQVVGLVSVGVRKEAVNSRLSAELVPLVVAGLLAGALGGLGAAVIARRVRRQTRGLRAAELRDMHDYHDAVLHSVTEGLVLVDPSGRVRLANDEARRLLDLAEDPAGRRAADLGLPATLVTALTDEQPREDTVLVTERRVLVLNKARAHREGEDLGSVVTIRDRTDLEALTGELGQARSLTEALRSQAHESGNRLHTMVSLIELGHPERAVAFATEELDRVQRLTDRVVTGVDDPTLSALLLGKTAEAHERGVDLAVAPDLWWPADLASPTDTVTIVGNLVDNALDAVALVDGERRVELATSRRHDTLELVVADSGPGIPVELRDRVVERGFTTNAGDERGGRGLGLALVRHTVERLGGHLEIGAPPGGRVTVTLPLPDPAVVPTGGAGSTASGPVAP